MPEGAIHYPKGSLTWAHSRAEHYSNIYPAIIYLVFAVGYGDFDYRFSGQIVGTAVPGRVRPVASYRAGHMVGDDVPVVVKSGGDVLESLTIPLPWKESDVFPEIKGKWRAWVRGNHPDIGGDQTVFRAVEQRYQIAKDKAELQLQAAAPKRPAEGVLIIKSPSHAATA